MSILMTILHVNWVSRFSSVFHLHFFQNRTFRRKWYGIYRNITTVTPPNSDRALSFLYPTLHFWWKMCCYRYASSLIIATIASSSKFSTEELCSVRSFIRPTSKLYLITYIQPKNVCKWL